MEQVLSLLLRLPPKAWKKLSWRQGEKRKLASRFAALRVRPAHRDYEQHEAHPEQWLLIEWPRGRSGTDEVLAVESARSDEAQRPGRAPQAALDHRAGLSGAQARAGTEPIRRSGLARISPSRDTFDRGVGVPGGREEPFFPLCVGRPAANIPARGVCAIPSARGGSFTVRCPTSGWRDCSAAICALLWAGRHHGGPRIPSKGNRPAGLTS